MDLDELLLSRLQFAFVITFHIVFPAFTIGLAAWLATIETMRLATGNAIYRRVFDFWPKGFAVSFGVGVVSGVACWMGSLGTMASSFWILANNSWMQAPLGHAIVDGLIVPTDWLAIVLGPVQM